MTSDIQDLSVSESRTHTEMSEEKKPHPQFSDNLDVQIIRKTLTYTQKGCLHHHYLHNTLNTGINFKYLCTIFR